VLRTVRETNPDTVELRHADEARVEFGNGDGQLTRDRTLARPAIDEHHVGRVVMVGEVPQCRAVDAAAAHDAHGVVRDVKVVGVSSPPAHQDPDGRAGPRQRREHDVGAAQVQHQLGHHRDRVCDTDC